MGKDKRIHVVDHSETKPAPKVETPTSVDPVEAASDPVEVAATSVPPAPSVADIMAKLSPEEQAVLKAQLRAKAKKAAGANLQGVFDAALAKATAALSDLHASVLAFGFPADMPFQLMIGTSLEGKPFVEGKRLRHRETKAKDAAPVTAPAPDATPAP